MRIQRKHPINDPPLLKLNQQMLCDRKYGTRDAPPLLSRPRLRPPTANCSPNCCETHQQRPMLLLSSASRALSVFGVFHPGCCSGSPVKWLEAIGAPENRHLLARCALGVFGSPSCLRQIWPPCPNPTPEDMKLGKLRASSPHTPEPSREHERHSRLP